MHERAASTFRRDVPWRVSIIWRARIQKPVIPLGFPAFLVGWLARLLEKRLFFHADFLIL